MNQMGYGISLTSQRSHESGIDQLPIRDNNWYIVEGTLQHEGAFMTCETRNSEHSHSSSKHKFTQRAN